MYYNNEYRKAIIKRINAEALIMKLLKKVLIILVSVTAVVLVIVATHNQITATTVKPTTTMLVKKNTNNTVSVKQAAAKPVPTTAIISQKIQGTWFFYDVIGHKHVMVITGNTLKLDNQKAYTVNRNGFIYYYGDGIYQLGFAYSDTGYAFRPKVQKINGRNENTLLMMGANFTNPRVLTHGQAKHFANQDFYN